MKYPSGKLRRLIFNRSLAPAAIAASTLVFTTSAWGVATAYSGSWFNPDQNGHGFSVEVLNDQTSIIYWYVYDHDGAPIFLIAIGENKGSTIEAEAYYHDGMKFGEFDPANIEQVLWGTVDIEFHSCNSATMSYDSDMVHSGQVFGSGEIELVRLASVDGLPCSEHNLDGVYTVTADLFTGGKASGTLIFSYDAFFGMYTGFRIGGEAYEEFVSGQITNISEDSGEFEYVMDVETDGGWEPDYIGTGYFGDDGIAYLSTPSASVNLGKTTIGNEFISQAELAGSYELISPMGEHWGDVQIGASGDVSIQSGDCKMTGTQEVIRPGFNTVWTGLSHEGCKSNWSVGLGLKTGAGQTWYMFPDNIPSHIMVMRKKD